MKKIFRTVALGLGIITTTPAMANEAYQINRIYQQLKDLAQSHEFSQFRYLVMRTRAASDQRIRETFLAMDTIASGDYDQHNGAKLTLSFCVTADTSAILHLVGQRNNILRHKMNNLHRATQAIVNNQVDVNNCLEIYATYQGFSSYRR